MNTDALNIMAYDKIIMFLNEQKIKTSDKINERALTHRFNMSRSPIRQALFRLEKEGKLTYKKSLLFC